MIKQTKRLLVVLMLAVTALAPPYAFGSSVNDLRRQQQQNQQKRNEAGVSLAQTREERSEAQAEVDRIDAEHEIVVGEVVTITEQLEVVTENLSGTIISLARARDERETQYSVFKDRVRVMYMNGSVGYLDVLFSADDFSDFLSRMDYVNLITEYDKGVLDRLQTIEGEIEVYLDAVERQKRETEVLKAQLDKKQIELEIAIAAKKELVDRLGKNERHYEQQIADLNESDKWIENRIKQIQAEEARKAAAAAAARANAATVYTGGVVGWPLPGYSRESSGYGYRKSPINGRREFHKGIDLPAPTGTPIVSAEGGSVIFAGTMNGYGKVVIVEHGNGMSTLYAHCSRIDVSDGQRVSRGQTIARVGSTGNSTGPHLHFETRIGGVHKNPWNYLK